MKVRIRPGPPEVARESAAILAGVIAQRPQSVLGLLTGRTAVPFYDELARLREAGRLDLSRARGFNVDELRLPPQHPSSFRSFMSRHAWERTGLDRQRCDIPSGTAEPAAECRRYDAALAAAGGLDLAVLGVGADGHVAYNLPGPPQEETHLAELPEALAVRLDVPERWRPLQAITVGFAALRSARRLLLMATGAAKARAVRALVEGPEDPRWPCALLRGHPRFDVVLDREAAGELS